MAHSVTGHTGSLIAEFTILCERDAGHADIYDYKSSLYIHDVLSMFIMGILK